MNLNNLYEQTSVVSHKLVNLAIFLLVSIAFIPGLYSPTLRFKAYVWSQMFGKGNMQTDVISLVVISLIIISFFFEHLSRLIGQLIDPQIYFTPNDFNLLIAKRFLNIYTLYRSRKDGGSDSRFEFRSTINDSVSAVFSTSDPANDLYRQLSINQNRYRFMSEYMATFKTLIVIGVVGVAIAISTQNWRQLIFSLAGLVILAFMWYLSAVLAYSVVWRLLDRYWANFKTTQIPKQSILYHDYSNCLNEANLTLFEDDLVLIAKDFKGLNFMFNRAKLLLKWSKKLFRHLTNNTKNE